MPSYEQRRDEPWSAEGRSSTAQAVDRIIQRPRDAGLQGDTARLLAHELRADLSVVAGYLSLIEDGSLGAVPEAALPVVRTLLARVRSMDRIIDATVDDGRLEDGRLHLVLAPVDLSVLLEEEIEMVRELATEPTHDFRLTVPRRPVMVEVDQARVSAIVRNLLHNAVKYSPEGGTVRCRVDLDHANKSVRVAVSDEGVGLDPDRLEQIFNRFERGGPAAATSGPPGIGLGLYISRTLARLHGGDLTAECRRRGSRFVLRLPVGSP